MRAFRGASAHAIVPLLFAACAVVCLLSILSDSGAVGGPSRTLLLNARAPLVVKKGRAVRLHLAAVKRQHRAMLQGNFRLCAALLIPDGLAVDKHVAPSAMAHCMSQVLKQVANWKNSDECRECESSGADCDKCAAVARGEAKGHYSGGTERGGGWSDAGGNFPEGEDFGGEMTEDDFKEMSNFFKNDPMFKDMVNDPMFKDMFKGGGAGSLPPLSPEEEKEFDKFEKDLDKAIADLEAEEAERKGRDKKTTKPAGARGRRRHSTQVARLEERRKGLQYKGVRLPTHLHWLD